ncbi:hypothetical protein HDU98_005089 [Podochytrium sp. JEL0797]|nr:hypothetical protein HDU98_005089 [Podochytrium sp. JEL0797]
MSQHHPAANTFTYKFSKPLVALVLYASLSTVVLHYVYTRLDYEEQRIAARRKIGALQTELDHWRKIKEDAEAAGRFPPQKMTPLGGVSANAAQLGLTAPHLALLLAPVPADSPLKSVALLTLTKCVPIAVLAKETYPKNKTVAIGLGLSMMGDLFLGLSHEHYFMHGLGSFLLAHIAYIKATQENKPPLAPLALAGFGSLAAGILHQVLLPSVPRDLKIPVVIYGSVLAGMAWRATARFLQTRQAVGTPKKGKATAAALDAYTRAKWGLGGAICFMLSDFILGYDKFVSPVGFASVWIMVTYYAAQIAIAKSV